MQKLRIYLDDSYDPIITKIKSLSDNPSLTRILCTFLDLMNTDEELSERILKEINSHHLDQQLKQWLHKEKG